MKTYHCQTKSATRTIHTNIIGIRDDARAPCANTKVDQSQKDATDHCGPGMFNCIPKAKSSYSHGDCRRHNDNKSELRLVQTAIECGHVVSG